MTDSPNHDKPRPAAGATDPAFKATPRAGKPDGKPGVPPDGKQEAFKVIRSAPPPASDGPGAGPIIAIAVLVLVAVGGVLYARRNTNSAATTATTATAPPPAGKPAPDFVIGTIEDSESISGAAKALLKAKEYRAEYPNAPNLEEKIAELERKLGQAPSAAVSFDARLEEARALLEQRRFVEGIEAATAITREATEPRIVGAAHYLAAQGYAANGDVPSAEVELQAAEDAGADKATIDRMRSQLRGG